MSFKSISEPEPRTNLNTAEFLAAFKTPGIETFGKWLEIELTRLESKWRHASSPRALQGFRDRGRR